MVPYWALGFQLSRWGYTTIDQLKQVVARMRENDIPHVSTVALVIFIIIFHYNTIMKFYVCMTCMFIARSALSA